MSDSITNNRRLLTLSDPSGQNLLGLGDDPFDIGDGRTRELPLQLPPEPTTTTNVVAAAGRIEGFSATGNPNIDGLLLGLRFNPNFGVVDRPPLGGPR